MNRAATAYFGTQVGIHALCALALRRVSIVMSDFYAELLVGKALPPMTEWVMAYHWWPFCFVALSAVGLIFALATSGKGGKLLHIAFALQCLSTLCVLNALLAYIVPLVPIQTCLSV